MLKGVFFTLGLANGAYVGIKMRDAGFATALTKNYYNNKSQSNPILNLDPKELSQLYDAGLVDSPEKLENFALIKSVEDFERMQEFLNKEREERLSREAAKNNKH